jgi:hypothetical protein
MDPPILVVTMPTEAQVHMWAREQLKDSRLLHLPRELACLLVMYAADAAVANYKASDDEIDRAIIWSIIEPKLEHNIKCSYCHVMCTRLFFHIRENCTSCDTPRCLRCMRVCACCKEELCINCVLEDENDRCTRCKEFICDNCAVMTYTAQNHMNGIICRNCNGNN